MTTVCFPSIGQGEGFVFQLWLVNNPMIFLKNPWIFKKQNPGSLKNKSLDLSKTNPLIFQKQIPGSLKKSWIFQKQIPGSFKNKSLDL
jgi:hypothetical protein